MSGQKKFPKQLRKAWLQYQDLYDRHMRLLRQVGDGDINGVYSDYESEIQYAQESWQSPEERFDTGEFSDLDLGLDDES